MDGGEFSSGEGIYSLNENAEQTQSFFYTGDVQTFTPQYSGFYFIEAWGATGGKDATAGGAGGYVKAHIYLEAGKTIYISCGSKGGDKLVMNATPSDAVGGWNGGARSGSGNSTGYSGAGGGASFVNTLQKCIPVELVPNNNPEAGTVKITYQADSVGLATPTRPGYKFVGWSLEGAGSVSSNLLGGTIIFCFTDAKATLKVNWQKI